jgi:uncharacterized membrane protein YfcA
MGQFFRGLPPLDWTFIASVMVAVFAGGQIGSRFGSQKFKPVYIRRITSILILVASINILKDHL